jgi:hypothetical protein
MELMEKEKIKEIIESEISLELSLERNNPEEKAKKNVLVKTNYLKERLEHLRNRINFKIENLN